MEFMIIFGPIIFAVIFVAVFAWLFFDGIKVQEEEERLGIYWDGNMHRKIDPRERHG